MNLADRLKLIIPDELSRRLMAGDGFEVYAGERRLEFEQLKPVAENGRLRFKEINGDLLMECSVQLQPDYAAARWEWTLTNQGELPAKPISQLSLLSFSFESTAGLRWHVLTAHGGTTEDFYPPLAYRTDEQVIRVVGQNDLWCQVGNGYTEIASHKTGRSSNKNIPLMLATYGEDEQSPGFFCGLEWSAAWFMRLTVNESGNIVKAGPKIKDLVLKAGETLRLPPVHMGFFEGGLEAGTNALRRYVHECVAARYEGNPVIPPVSYDHWFGIENNYDESLLRRQADRAAELGIEFFVVDAAWFPGGFPFGVGNLDSVDAGKFPNGLEPFAEYVRSKGMKFGLWFEPERASADTEIIRNHPGWFAEITSPEWEGEVVFPWAKVKPQFHLNLALRQAQDGMIAIIDRWISKLDIRWVRWDYNIEPQPVWEKIDPTGKIQFAYMQGLYRVLDTLMSKHPQCFMECCAAGGRRFDLGMARRAHTSWLSDHTVDPHICRYMQARSNRFWPGNFANSAVAVNFGEGDRCFSDMSVLSRMVGTLAFGGDIASWSTEWSLRVAALVRRYKEIRHLLVQDFYQLSPLPATERDWDIVQFADRDSQEGVFFVFRCKGKTASVPVHPAAVEDKATYLLKDLVNGTEITVSGKHLQETGVPVTLELNSAVLWHYRKIHLKNR